MGVIQSAHNAILAAHSMVGDVSPVLSPMVAQVKRCAARCLKLVGKRGKKQPILLQSCVDCARILTQTRGVYRSTPMDQQAGLYMMLCFAGFLRYDDAVKVEAGNVKFHKTHADIFIPQRKNTHFREGDVICIARGQSDVCPVRLLEQWIKSNNLRGATRVFGNEGPDRSIIFSRQRWDYNQAQSRVLRPLAAMAGVTLKQFLKSFGLHSFRSGGATYVAQKGVPEYVFQSHGGWRCPGVMQGYIARSLENKLLPTTVMRY